ncbi:hydroxyethylthiazole kinase [Leminorella grimontii]|uniref:hydroxyethylthiazole kinase n=1 Tax=Leminorella grimontii TaxID=82981 RepID=UPI002085E472|nr:hydroxyethylthiazole kinase [Leminorella grimontii]GKX58500.1 hydroxyethylthiazole kinase [Leminorella grimontii]
MTSSDPVIFSGAIAADSLSLLRKKAPLIHCLTNQVVQNFTANVLLALGASPAMVVSRQEVAEFAAIADALLVNVGTLHDEQKDAITLAVASANRAGVPWVLDPVAVGGLHYRTAFCRELIAQGPAVIRGNASEIMALAGSAARGRGVDSADASFAAQPSAKALAQETGAVVAVTGDVDYITDGHLTYSVPYGSPMMTRVVGTGCALSAAVAAFIAASKERRLERAASACMVMAACGGIAAAEVDGPGSFTPRFLDLLYQLRPQRLEEMTV